MHFYICIILNFLFKSMHIHIKEKIKKAQLRKRTQAHTNERTHAHTQTHNMFKDV
jgi:hypothetical protein